MASLRRPNPAGAFRYTVDASVFVNAFNQHELGHAESLALLTVIRERGDPIIVPTLVLAEVASAIARETGNSREAARYVTATAEFPHLVLVSLTPVLAVSAADLAADYRLRGADSVYVEVARRYATTLISRDNDQITRGAAVVPCQTPEVALAKN